MSYPGNSSLSVQAQERVMTAFKQVLTNLQAGQREEAAIGLEFVLRLDPTFAPAGNLKRQLSSSSKEIDLGDIIAQLQAPTTEAINALLIEAVDDFNSREFITAKEKVELVLVDLPGHQEARELRDQIDKALKIENQVGQFLIQAREALGAGDPQEAANFVMMAQALDPHHTGIASTLHEIETVGGAGVVEPAAAESQKPGASTDDVAPIQDPGATSRTSAVPDDESDAFAVEFDTSDPFADVLDPEPEQPEPAEAPFSAGDEAVSFPPMDDTDDLFTAPGGATGFAAPDSGTPSDDAGEDGDEVNDGSIPDLIDSGKEALRQGWFAQAISIWSRVFLIKPEHPEAAHLIERAKKRFAEAESQVESLLRKARDAFDEGEFDAARLLVGKALAVQPNHIQVTMLKEELDREVGGGAVTAPADAKQEPESPPAPSELPELDDDLLGEQPADLPPDDAAETADPAADATGDELFDDDFDLDDLEDFGDLSLVERLKSRLPLRLVAVVGVALVVLLAGFWLGGRFLSSEPEVDDSIRINEVLVEADRLFRGRKTEEALHLLREFPASGLGRQRIDMRIAKYEESLAPPTPTPVPEQATRAESMLAQGLWWSAYRSAADGLEAHPDDPGLAAIRQRVEDTEPEAAVLESAIRRDDFRTAVSIVEDLLAQYPDQGDLVQVYERCLFNAALAESRAYNLTGAENHLVRLLEVKPQDEEARRFLEFVQKYKVRAADMRLEIFIRSMDER